jgi:uncharacterized protein YfaS (alpha-2-macroglobulin family)
VAASAKQWSDASEFALPVWTPATTEGFATYGEIDEGAVRQPVAMPTDATDQFGGLEISTSSTQLQALTDAFVYLVRYPYECAEQTSSRVLAIAALRDVLTAFHTGALPEPKQLASIVERDLTRLKSMQNDDGGFAFWMHGYDSWPFITIHVAHALTRAKGKGFAVDKEMMQRALGYLRVIERHLPWYYPEDVKRTLRAYALYVRKLGGDTDIAKATALLEEAKLEGLNMEAIGWLLGTLAGNKGSATWIGKIHRYLDNRVTETAGAAHWAVSYQDGGHLILNSDRRADGVILESLIKDDPKNDLIPKVVRGLLAHRTRGRWGNTQENAFVLLALDQYFATYEKVTPNFVARIWLGDRLAGEEGFKGRETKRFQVDVPMSYLAQHKGTQDVIVGKNGKGRLYYRIGLNYALKSLWLAPTDQGFAVERQYEAIDDPGDVHRQKDGSWKIKAGARVRVRLHMVAEARRYHVALVDPLPAGLEPMNPALAVTGMVPLDEKAQKEAGRYWWWSRTWYEHQNMRDDRVEAFASLLWEGVHEYSYVARATTPGSFIVPPAKTEEMYFPETFGRSGSDKVVIE